MLMHRHGMLGSTSSRSFPPLTLSATVPLRGRASEIATESW